jgi:hypothetical protein
MTGKTKRALVVTGLISLLGGIGGALTAVVLTYLGNRIAGAAYAPSVVVYRWNIGVFATLGMVFGPMLAWTMLRNVPLWRTMAEPALAGLAGTLIAFVFAPVLFPVLAPVAILLSAWRLERVYRHRNALGVGPARLEG